MVTEFLVRTVVSFEKLRAAISAAFGIRAEDVAVVDSIADATANGPLTAEVIERGGEFSQQITIYSVDSLRTPSCLEVERFLADALGQAVLVSDDSPNPYTMMLVEPDGRVYSVRVDVYALDERDEYTLE